MNHTNRFYSVKKEHKTLPTNGSNLPIYDGLD